MRTMVHRGAPALTLALTLAVAGCASAGGASRPEGSGVNRIVQEEFGPLGQLDALQAIQRLRPQWLRSRSGVGGEAPVLYVDGARRSSADELRFIRADEVQEAEHMNAADASTRFGTGHSGGAILIRMIR